MDKLIIEVNDGVMTARYAVAGPWDYRDGVGVIRAGRFLGSAGGVIFDPPADFHYRRGIENTLAALARLSPESREALLADLEARRRFVRRLAAGPEHVP